MGEPVFWTPGQTDCMTRSPGGYKWCQPCPPSAENLITGVFANGMGNDFGQDVNGANLSVDSRPNVLDRV